MTVVFGEVNSFTPTIEDGGDIPLDNDPAPELEVITGKVWLEVTLASADDEGAGIFAGDVTAAEIKNGTTLPTQTNTLGRITLATITVADGDVTVINQSVTHSLGHQRCAGPVHRFWGV